MAQFIKQGNNFYRKDEKGNLFTVSDPDTIKGLSSGQLPFQGIPNDRGLKFAEDTTPAPTPTTGSTGDIGSVLKDKLITALNAYKGVSDTSQLEQKRQELLRKQLLSSPYSEEGEKNLTGSAKLSLLRSKGSEFEPEIKSIEEQIIKARNGDTASLAGLSKLVELGKDMGLFGAEGGYQSALGKEYADYVANEKANGSKKIMSLNEYANMDANRKKSVTNFGLSPNQVNSTVNSIAGAFDNEPIVKAYNTTQEGYQTIKSIGTKTNSPADDIAFIYAFAKIMDPNSVVREGEYNTVQKYAQSWADTFGFKAKRIFSNTNFLGSDAKEKMLNALEAKVSTIEKQYANTYNEYQRQIQDAYSGNPRSITDYSKTDYSKKETPKSKFSDISSSLTKDSAKKEVYIPRSVWNTLGARMDELIKEISDTGYRLLVKD